jgi:hypothetical protein
MSENWNWPHKGPCLIWTLWCNDNPFIDWHVILWTRNKPQCHRLYRRNWTLNCLLFSFVVSYEPMHWQLTCSRNATLLILWQTMEQHGSVESQAGMQVTTWRCFTWCGWSFATSRWVFLENYMPFIGPAIDHMYREFMGGLRWGCRWVSTQLW